MSEPLIALQNVEVLYADVILSLKGITLEVASGGCTVLLGPNGAGKSTTLKSISGMLDVEEGRVSSGQVRMLGKDVTGVSAEQMVADGVVQDDYMDGAVVFVDMNNDGAFTYTDANEDGQFTPGEESEPYTYTDSQGHFKFSFNPNGAPIIALGGVDTASGKPNDSFVFKIFSASVVPGASALDMGVGRFITCIEDFQAAASGV